MQYKLFSDRQAPYQELVLKNRGIEDVDAWLNASDKDINYPSAFGCSSIDRAVEFLKQVIDNTEKVCVVVDADADGYSSAAIAINWLFHWNPDLKTNLTYILHTGKQHGLADVIDRIPEDTKLVLIPDAGTNDTEQILLLINKNMRVLIMDHHESEKWLKDDNVVIINNQICDYPNKDLAGAGVTWQVCRAYEIRYRDDWAQAPEWVDLAALGVK